MKIGGFILALLVTFLSVFPCCTSDECGDEGVIENQHQEVPNENEGSCSPFLNCGSCAGFTAQTTQEENGIDDNLPVDKTTAHYPHRVTSEVINNIWQPPRLY